MRYFVLALALVGLCQSATVTHSQRKGGKADIADIHFLLWTRSNSGDGQAYELFVGDTGNLAGSPFDASRPTHVLAHGWNSQGESGWPVNAKTELLSYYDCNVISVDWGTIANNVNYIAVVNDLPSVGQHTASLLDFLHDQGGLDITSVHMAGHSLGSHLSGYTGSYVANGPIGRITGLDPAGPEFYEASNVDRLDSADASFVEIIHTNAGGILEFCVGLKDALGHVDYYPNGGDHQPGCTIGGDWTELLTSGCSHSRAYEYWIESINGGTPFTSVPCSDWGTYDAGGCPDCGQGCLDMGMHASTGLGGLYFLRTNALSPFAQG